MRVAGAPRLAAGIATALSLAAEVRAAAVTVRPLDVPDRVSIAALVRPGAFNGAGNLLVGWRGVGPEEDRLVELTPAGATVWECRLRPGGSLTAFARAADGTTLAAQWVPGRFGRILAVDSSGRVRSACRLSVPDPAPPPRPASLHALPGGEVLVSVPGWAARLSRRWRVEAEMLHRWLQSVAPLSDGRWLATFRDPDRFAVYDPESHSLTALTLDALCQLWEARRAEEVSPGRWRFYGCFCVPEPAPPGEEMPRKTMEVLDTDAEGRFLWAWGSVRAMRVEEFGVQKCATYTRAVSILPGDHLLVVDGYPADCRVAELDASGEPVRIYMQATATTAVGGGNGIFGENACGLVGLEVLPVATSR